MSEPRSLGHGAARLAAVPGGPRVAAAQDRAGALIDARGEVARRLRTGAPPRVAPNRGRLALSVVAAVLLGGFAARAVFAAFAGPDDASPEARLRAEPLTPAADVAPRAAASAAAARPSSAHDAERASAHTVRHPRAAQSAESLADAPRIERASTAGASIEGPSREGVSRDRASPEGVAPDGAAMTPLGEPTSWSELADVGRNAEALALVEARGVDVVLSRASADDLVRLGRVANLASRAPLAERAYAQLRERFAGTRQASLAAFELGRLAHDPRDAARAYDAYLAERPEGPLAREARGRRLEARLAARDAHVADAARDYLAHHPSGPHAGLARSVLE